MPEIQSLIGQTVSHYRIIGRQCPVTAVSSSGIFRILSTSLNISIHAEWFNARARSAAVRSQISWKKKKEIAAERLAVYIGIAIAYKKRSDSPWGQSVVRRNTMATKKARKSTKSLKKSKKLAKTKPLSFSWGARQT